MPMTLIVTGLEIRDTNPGMQQRDPLIHVQTLLMNLVIERLNKPIPPRLTRRDVPDPDLVFAEISQSAGDRHSCKRWQIQGVTGR